MCTRIKLTINLIYDIIILVSINILSSTVIGNLCNKRIYLKFT